MRFKRMFIYEFQDTYRKRLAFLRKQQQERNSYPLLAEQIAEQQLDVDTEMAERREYFKTQHALNRQRRAHEWRQGRAKLAQYPAKERRRLLAYWQRCSLPADPEYFLTMMHMHDTGRLDMNPPVFGVLSRNRRKFRQPINVACPAPGRWGRPNSRVTSRHFDHGNASRMSRPDCSGLDGAD